MAGQNKATLRRKLQSALAHKKLANELLDSLVDTQTRWNAVLDKLDVDGAAPVVGVAEVTEIDVANADVAGNYGGTYFLISSPTVDYYVWFDVDNASVDPAVAGRTGIEVDIATGDTAAVIGDAIQAVLDAHAAFSATDDDGGIVTVTNAATGAATNAAIGTAPMGSVAATTQGVTAVAGLDTNYEATQEITDLLDPDAEVEGAQSKTSLRKCLRSALAHRALADEILDAITELQAAHNALVAKLDAEAGTLDDGDYVDTLGVTVMDPADDMAGQHKASMRRSLRSALANESLADEILDAIVALQESLNDALAELDAATINGQMAALKVTVMTPDAEG